MVELEDLKNSINKCRINIENAKKRAGRIDDVILIGATKTQPKELITEINDLKLLEVVGENHVQEIREKYEYGPNLKWHMIGQLQSNKVKYIIDKVELIHSLDRESLAQEINKQAEKHNLKMKCLVEINMGSELTKGGIDKTQLLDFLTLMKNYKNIEIKGLMSVLPNLDNKDELKQLYIELHNLFIEAQRFDNNMTILSSGMTNDYELAVEYGGSNMVRLGRTLFGARV